MLINFSINKETTINNNIVIERVKLKVNHKVYPDNIPILKEKGEIPYWEIASRLGVHVNTIRNWMKSSMSQKQREMVLEAIKVIKEVNSEVETCSK
jgi:DNA-binding transcriptional regulator YiaG